MPTRDLLSLGDLVDPRRHPQVQPFQHRRIQSRSVGDTSEQIIGASFVSSLAARPTAQTSLDCHALLGPNIVAIIDSSRLNLNHVSRGSTIVSDLIPEEGVADSSWAGHRLTSWANSGSSSFCLSMEPD